QQAERQERDARRLAQRRLFDARLAEARAVRRSRQVGQRLGSLKALQEAAGLATELDLGTGAGRDLRNEAITSLGLADFRLVHEWPPGIPNMIRTGTFDRRLEHYAVTDSRGIVFVRRMDTNQEAARLICPEKVSHWALFSPDGKFLTTNDNARSWSVTVW